MKFPSVKNLAQDAINTFRRFPFEVLFALAGAIAATIYIHSDDTLPYSLYTKLMMTAELGLVLSLAASLFIESLGAGPKYLVRVAVALVACCTFFIYNYQLRGIDGIRFFLLGLAFHLAVSFSAFTAKGQIQGFWQFNKTLFLRFLASILYSMVLYLGLAASVSASNFLFNLHLEYKIYGIVYAWILGVFNTVFFLSGVPANITELEGDDSYPKGLKVFTQYVLIPLASVYVVILFAYEVKLLIQWHLPKGLVSNLILGYSVFGILSILLIYPLRNRDGNTWIKTYARSFYFLLVPLLVLLFLAILSRVMPYGITPYRYFLLALAGWLTFITFYFLLSKKQNIKVIPASLCVITLFTIWGPQSAFSVSETSQRALLIKIFKKYRAFNDGKLQALSNQKLSKKDGDEAIEKVRYFVNDMDISSLQPLMNQNIARNVDSIRHKIGYQGGSYGNEYELQNNELNWITNQLGLRKFNSNYAVEVYDYNFQNENNGILITKGYDYVISTGSSYQYIDSGKTIQLKGEALTITRKKLRSGVYFLTLNNETVSFDIKKLADSLRNSENKLKAFADSSAELRTYKLPAQMLSFRRQTKHYIVTLQIGSLTVSNTDNSIINEIEGSYLVKVLK